MKRDLDLARQLLFDIEAHGDHCTVSTLRANLTDGSDDRIRYHLRLLIDAQLVKEIDRTQAGTPCVRLTNAGHELLELARSDANWHDARRRTLETTGGESLTVIRTLLTKWAVQTAVHGDPTPYRQYGPGRHRIEQSRRYGYYNQREPLADEHRIEFVRTCPDYRERAYMRNRFDWRNAYERDLRDTRDLTEERRDFDETSVGVSLPVSLI